MRGRGTARRWWGGALAFWAALWIGTASCTMKEVEAPVPPDLPPPSLDRPRAETAGVVAADTGAADAAADVADPAAAGAPAVPADPRDADLPRVRALWVVRTSLVHPDSVRAVVDRAARGGFNTLLVQVRGRGDAWYRSTREPRAQQLAGAPPGFDPLALMVEEAAHRGIQVHAWVNAQLVAGALAPPSDELHLVNRRPELLAVPRELARELFAVDPRAPGYLEALMAHARANPDQVEGLYASPLLPEHARHLALVVEELASGYDLDGIHLDYLRLPSRSFDHGRPALEAFRARMRARTAPPELRGAERAWREGEIFAYVDAFPEAWDDFRRSGVQESLEAVAAAARGSRPGILLSAAVFPDPADAHEHRFQDWEAWLGRGLVDVVVPMSYTNRDDVFARALQRALDAGGTERVWMGVGAYSNSFAGAVDRVRVVAAAGLGGVALFSYDWAAGGEGWRAAGGEDYLERFGREAFRLPAPAGAPTAGTGIPPSGR